MLIISRVLGLVMMWASAADKRTPSVASTAECHSLNAIDRPYALSMCKL